MQDPTKQNAWVPPSGGLSESEITRLNKLRETIFANARRKVDPEGIGFDARAQSFDGSIWSHLDEAEFKDWLEAFERFVSVVSQASQRVSLGLASVGFAIAGSIMVGNERTTTLGDVGLAVSAVFAVWFAAVNIIGAGASQKSE